MSEAEILIKGELHSSQGDLKEEREVLKEGADHVILEGPEQKNWQFKPRQLWFGWLLLIFESLFARHLYVDKSIIEDLAEVQNAERQFTRRSNASILENAHTSVKIISAVLFFVLFTTALIVGMLGQKITGALLLLMSSLAPLLILRIDESRRASVGRDIQIAEMTEKAAEDSDQVVVIVGQDHTEQIAEALPDEFDVETRPPAYRRLSLSHLKELVFPVIVSFSVLYIVYSALLAYIQILI